MALLVASVLAAASCYLAGASSAKAGSTKPDDNSHSSVALLQARLDQLHDVYGEKLGRLQRELEVSVQELRAALLLAHDETTARPDDVATIKALARSRRLDEVDTDYSTYTGISLKRDRSFISLGAEGDTRLVRAGAAHLAMMADTVTFRGDVCVGGDDGCLSVSSDGELLFNGDGLEAGSGIGDFVNKSLVGRQCRTVDTSSVAAGCVQSRHGADLRQGPPRGSEQRTHTLSVYHPAKLCEVETTVALGTSQLDHTHRMFVHT
jgi:hypothetical protein